MQTHSINQAIMYTGIITEKGKNKIYQSIRGFLCHWSEVGQPLKGLLALVQPKLVKNCLRPLHFYSDVTSYSNTDT